MLIYGVPALCLHFLSSVSPHCCVATFAVLKAQCTRLNSLYCRQMNTCLFVMCRVFFALVAALSH